MQNNKDINHKQGFILDFYCAQKRLCIEVDGPIHEKQKEYDAERSTILKESKGVKVIRFKNEEVLGNLDGVLEAIGSHLTPHQNS